MSRIVEVYSALNAPEAHLLVSLLLEHQIQGRVVGEALAGGAGELPVGHTSAPRIWVHEEHAEQAKQLIEEWRISKASAPESTAWDCPECNSEVDAGFDVCWNCEASRAPMAN